MKNLKKRKTSIKKIMGLDLTKANNSRGITLIALVVTIIVLLILAGVSIQMLTGETGILRQAKEAKDRTNKESLREQIQLEALDSYDNNGIFSMEKFKEKLKNDLGVNLDDIEDSGDRSIIFPLDGYEVTVTEEENGKITVEVEKRTDKDTGDEIKVTLEKGAIENKQVTLTAKVTNKPSGSIKYELYIDEELEETKSTAQRNVTFEYKTTFGEVKAYVKVKASQEDEKKSNEVVITDNSIEKLEELKKFREEVNNGKTYERETITQITDIDMKEENQASWTPIGTKDRPFKGTYDGKDHVITNMYIEGYGRRQGLFGYNEGTIKNLGIESGSMELGTESGAIVGYNNGGIIEKCYNEADINAKGNVIGGVCGMSNGTIKRCYNGGNITGTYTAAYQAICGISGQVGKLIEECYNTGNITCTSNYANCRACGISEATGEGDFERKVNSCYNTGTIKSVHIGIENSWAVASGIIGQSGHSLTISNCYNIGEIIIEAENPNPEARRQAAILGCTSSTAPEAIITNCYYLEGTAPYERGMTSSDYPIIIGNALNDAQMRNLADTLGESFTTGESGYPILKWQIEK